MGKSDGVEEPLLVLVVELSLYPIQSPHTLAGLGTVRTPLRLSRTLLLRSTDKGMSVSCTSCVSLRCSGGTSGVLSSSTNVDESKANENPGIVMWALWVSSECKEGDCGRG